MSSKERVEKITSDSGIPSPVPPPNSSPLLSSQLLHSRQPAVLCPRVSSLCNAADLSFPCVITHNERLAQIFVLYKLETVNKKKTHNGQQSPPGSGLLQNLDAVFPSHLWARSFWDPIQEFSQGSGDLFGAPGGVNANDMSTVSGFTKISCIQADFGTVSVKI